MMSIFDGPERKETITFLVCDYVFCHEMTFFDPKSAHYVFFATLGFPGIHVIGSKITSKRVWKILHVTAPFRPVSGLSEWGDQWFLKNL